MAQATVGTWPNTVFRFFLYAYTRTYHPHLLSFCFWVQSLSLTFSHQMTLQQLLVFIGPDSHWHWWEHNTHTHELIFNEGALFGPAKVRTGHVCRCSETDSSSSRWKIIKSLDFIWLQNTLQLFFSPAVSLCSQTLNESWAHQKL